MDVTSVNQDPNAAMQVSVLKKAMDHALQKSTQLIESNTKPDNLPTTKGVGEVIDIMA